jgi:hypothetical protein
MTKEEFKDAMRELAGEAYAVAVKLVSIGVVIYWLLVKDGFATVGGFLVMAFYAVWGFATTYREGLSVGAFVIFAGAVVLFAGFSAARGIRRFYRRVRSEGFAEDEKKAVKIIAALLILTLLSTLIMLGLHLLG